MSTGLSRAQPGIVPSNGWAYRDDGSIASKLGGGTLDPLTGALIGSLGLVGAVGGRYWVLAGVAWWIAWSARVNPTSAGALQWLTPAVLRGTEYTWVILIATGLGSPEVAFAWLLSTAYHQYDTVYRLRQTKNEVPLWVRTVTGGWEGRVLALAAAGLAANGQVGGGWFEVLALSGAALLGIVYVAESVTYWRKQ